MAATKPASVEEVTALHQRQMNEAELRRKKLTDVYKNEPKVPITISPMYQPYFGRVMQVMLNGISIFVKIDGSRQMVPKSFADEIDQRRMSVDAILNKQHRMSNITANFEKSPGELALF